MSWTSWESPGPVGPSIRHPRSTREVYRPTVHDISEQSGSYTDYHLQAEDTILSVISSCSPRHQKSNMDCYCANFGSQNSLLSHYDPEVVVRPSPTVAYCYQQQQPALQTDMHRQRVIASAQQRRRLLKTPRSKSVLDNTTISNGWSKKTSAPHHCDPWFAMEDDKSSISLIATSMHSENTFNRIHNKLPNKLKTRKTRAKLMMPGTPLPVLNGYHQQLVHAHPKHSQDYCKWLSHSLKIQTFSVNAPRTLKTRSATVVRSVQRPKTSSSSDRLAPKVGSHATDMSVTGVHQLHKTNEEKRQIQ